MESKVAMRENGQAYTFHPGQDYGPPGTYLTRTENGKMVIDWSIAAQDEIRTFEVSYRVMNAVQVHHDAAELYRKFIGSDNAEKIRAAAVNLKLPPGAEAYKQGQDIKIWGHGPLQGEVDFAGPAAVTWQVSDLPPYTFVEGRVVMPAVLFPQASSEVYTGRDALAGILAEEEAWAGDANRQRWLARAQIAGALILVAGALIMVWLLWRRYGRAHPTQFDGPYCRDLPAPYSPAELSVLWNYKKVRGHDLTATLLDLARKVMRQLELVFPNMQDGDHRFGQGWYAYGAYTGFDAFHHSFNEIGNTVERSLKTAEKAVSKSSSGSGGGGGGGSSYGGR